MNHPNPPGDQQDRAFQSPFQSIHAAPLAGKRPASPKWIFLLSMLGVLIVVPAAILFLQWKNDPLRTLRQFPLEDYYANYSILEGTRFKSSLRAGEQLGWKESTGRQVLFQVDPSGKPIVVLIPPEYDKMQFSAGKKFRAELLIGEGGQIRAVYLKES